MMSLDVRYSNLQKIWDYLWVRNREALQEARAASRLNSRFSSRIVVAPGE
jgi:hypothetical protein